ncbi:hypothetical protein CFB46_33230 [Burkholderia sp. HI2761]|nr:hypothetical protein CFB46_33230 [Burkholderia sp. HI2761]
MPQAWPSKPDGSLAAMMLGADDRGGKGPSRCVQAVLVAWTPPPHDDLRPARGSPSAPGRKAALSA